MVQSHPSEGCCGRDDPCDSAAAVPLAMQGRARPGKVLWRIQAMDCATEANEIRHALAGLAGIAELRLQPASRTLTIRAEPAALGEAEAVLRRLGYPPLALDAGRPIPHGTQAVPWTRLIASLVLASAAEVLHLLLPPSLLREASEILLTLGAIGLVGLPVYGKGLRALRQGRLNINALMAVAVSGAVLIGHWPEAGMVMALYALAEALEARAAERARTAISRLMELAPEQASVELAPGRWQRLGVAAVTPGQRVRVEPGERIPLDGLVAAGHSAVNQAPITGESLPVEKGPGDAVFAGTVNSHASLEITVTAAASSSTLARIIHAVEEAQASRAPIQCFVDRFAARYTPAVFALAVAVALLSPPLLGLTPLDAVYRALVLLVIACPCALVIATPVTLVSGLTAAAGRGIVIKGGLHLERARRLRILAFDKTGTLTTGRPSLEAFEVIDGRVPTARLRQWTASLAARSDHPISRAIAASLEDERLPVQDLEVLGGRGVAGVIASQHLLLASHSTLAERGSERSALEPAVRAHQQRGRSVSLLSDGQGVLALIAVADQPRPTAALAVRRLRQLGITPLILSGDNAVTAAVMARQLGIELVRSELLPEEKLAAIKELQRQGPTGMVGDGINDAPALAGAELGVAMGAAGSDSALEAADVVVMDDDPLRLVDLIGLSRRTWRILWQNIALALGIKGAFLLLTLLGSATMWQAVFADMGTSLLVIGNGLRLLRPLPAVGPH